MNHLSRRAFLKASLATAGAAALPTSTPAQVFPSRPVTLICPFPPGPSTDAVMRAVALSASRTLGGTVVVENKPGAGGILGAVKVAGERPDGYTLTSLSNAAFIVPHMTKVAFDPAKDFTYIMCMFGSTYGMAVRADSPYKTMNDVLEFAKANPGKFTCSISGLGTMNHLTLEELAQPLGIQFLYVPYKGGSAATTAVLAGDVMAVSTTTDWAPYVDHGEMRLLATYGSKRTRRWSAVPTLKELGYGVVADGPVGFAGPRGMDPSLAKRLHDTFRISLDDPAVQLALERNSMQSLYLDSAGYTKLALDLYAQAKVTVNRLGLGIKG